MFCEKCGSAIAEGESVCSTCGAPVGVQPQFDTPEESTRLQDFAPQFDSQPQDFAPQFDTQPQDFAPQFDTQPQDFAPQFEGQTVGAQQPKKRMNKKLKIALFAGGGVLIAGLIVLLVLLLNRKPSMAELEKNSFHQALESFSDGMKFEDATYTVKLEPGQYLIDFAQTQNIDLSWLENVNVEFTSDTSSDRAGYRAALSLNGTQIGVISALMDLNSDKLMISADGLSDYIGEMDLNGTGMSAVGMVKAIDNPKTIKLIEKYYDIIFDSIENVKESSGDFTAGGVSQKCRILTADISMRQALGIVKKILTEAIDDPDFKDLLSSMYNTGVFGSYNSFDEMYEEVRDGIRNALDSVSNVSDGASDTTLFTLVDYVSDKTIIGRTIKVYFSSGQPIQITFGNAKSGDKFGTELSVNGKTYLSGSGTCSGSTLNGELMIYGGDTQLASLKLYNFDYDTNEGGVEISLTKSAWEMITRDSTLASALAIGSVRIDKTGDTSVINIMAGNERVLKATLTKRGKEAVNIDSTLKRTDINEWPHTVSIEELYDRLKKAGVPDEMLISLLVGVSNRADDMYNH